MSVQFNHLLGWVFHPFDGNSWTELFGGLGQLFSRLIYYLIVCAVGKIADICQLIFRKFAGLSDGLKVGNKVVEGDLVYYLFQHPIVKNLLISLALLAAFILIIATFVGTIKTEFAKDGNNNKRKVIKNAFRGLANFVLVPVICMFGIFIGNALLRAIDGATGGGSGSLASQMFLVGGYNANRARMSENNGDDRDNNPYKIGSFGDVLTGQSEGGAERGYGNFGIFLDDGGNSLTGRRAADKIDAFFENGAKIDRDQMENMSPIQHNLKFSALSTYYGGALADNVKVDYKDINYGASDRSYVDQSESITNDNGEVRIPYTAEITFSVYNAGLVYYYYDLTLGTFDYFISTIAMLFCAYTLLVTVLGLIKRLFMLTTLFIISAPVCAIYPIDEGKALERWRTEFIKETLSAYSTVVVMNIFLSLLPIIKEITVFANNGDLAFLGSIPMIKGFANYLARVLIVVAGLLFFKDASKTIASIIGANDAAGVGASASSGFAKRAGAGLAIGAGAVVGAARLAGKGIGAIDRSIQMRKDAKNAAKADLNNGEGGGGEDSKATEPGAVGAEQHSMNGAPAPAPAGGDTGGDASGAAGAPSSVGAGSNSMNGAGSGAGGGVSAEQKAAAKAKDKYERYDKASKSLFNSIENEKYKEDLDDKLKGHTKFGRGMIKAGGFLRGLHNSNLIRGFRNGVGGLFSAIGGIATGKGKIGDAFNWTKGSADARKKAEEYKRDLKEAKSGKKSAEQHAEEMSEQRAMEQLRIQEQRAMDQLKIQEQRELNRSVKENSLLIKIKDKQDAIERLQREIEDAKRKRDEIGGISGYLKTEPTIAAALDSIDKNQEELKRLVEELEKLNKKN